MNEHIFTDTLDLLALFEGNIGATIDILYDSPEVRYDQITMLEDLSMLDEAYGGELCCNIFLLAESYGFSEETSDTLAKLYEALRYSNHRYYDDEVPF